MYHVVEQREREENMKIEMWSGIVAPFWHLRSESHHDLQAA